MKNLKYYKSVKISELERGDVFKFDISDKEFFEFTGETQFNGIRYCYKDLNDTKIHSFGYMTCDKIVVKFDKIY